MSSNNIPVGEIHRRPAQPLRPGQEAIAAHLLATAQGEIWPEKQDYFFAVIVLIVALESLEWNFFFPRKKLVLCHNLQSLVLGLRHVSFWIFRDWNHPWMYCRIFFGCQCQHLFRRCWMIILTTTHRRTLVGPRWVMMGMMGWWVPILHHRCGWTWDVNLCSPSSAWPKSSSMPQVKRWVNCLIVKELLLDSAHDLACLICCACKNLQHVDKSSLASPEWHR